VTMLQWYRDGVDPAPRLVPRHLSGTQEPSPTLVSHDHAGCHSWRRAISQPDAGHMQTRGASRRLVRPESCCFFIGRSSMLPSPHASNRDFAAFLQLPAALTRVL
jgi:hypothetical protein